MIYNEDNLWRAIFTLAKIGKKYNLKISKSKTKVMAFQGKDLIRRTITLEIRPIEQVSHFNYLGWDIFYEYDNDIKNKLRKFQCICETLRRALRRTRKDFFQNNGNT